ncbi:MAG: DUF952 domain-containing protein [Acidiphilium sp.]|jgi:Uncharacterized protein conserved in bacteria|nr:DUF952 domain-containing protein [Acidiphilium sp.]
MTADVAYKVLSETEFAQFQVAGWFEGSVVDRADGFIHLSAAEQLAETIDRHFQGRDDLVIAAVQLPMLGAAVRWEISRGGQAFPHVYGVLPIGAVIAAGPLTRRGDGEVVLPG